MEYSDVNINIIFVRIKQRHTNLLCVYEKNNNFITRGRRWLIFILELVYVVQISIDTIYHYYLRFDKYERYLRRHRLT